MDALSLNVIDVVETGGKRVCPLVCQSCIIFGLWTEGDLPWVFSDISDTTFPGCKLRLASDVLCICDFSALFVLPRTGVGCDVRRFIMSAGDAFSMMKEGSEFLISADWQALLGLLYCGLESTS